MELIYLTLLLLFVLYCLSGVACLWLQLAGGIVWIFFSHSALWISILRCLSFFFFFCMGPCHNYQHELLCRSKTWAEVTEDNAQKVGCFFFNLWRSFCLCSAMGANNKWAHQPYRDTQPTNHQSFHFIPPATSTAAAKPNRLLNANSFISATALDSASSLALAIRFPHKKQAEVGKSLKPRCGIESPIGGFSWGSPLRLSLSSRV